MPKHTIHCDLTLRHSYRAGWNHLNDTLPVFTGRMTTPRTVQVDEDGEGWTQTAVMTLSPAELVRAKQQHRVYQGWAKANRAGKGPSFTRFLAGAAEDAFVAGCRCEHDCCGHVSSYATAVRTGPRTLSIRIRSTVNV